MSVRRIKPGGVVEIRDHLGQVTELHSSKCAHCQRYTEFPSLKVMHEHVDVCRDCMRLVCLECAGKPCRPIEKELERQEARARMLLDMGIGR